MRRRLTLRGRLALMSAGAVAIAIVLAATAAWLVTRDQLLRQVDSTLKATTGLAQQIVNPPNICALQGKAELRKYYGSVQVIDADGNQLCPQPDGPVPQAIDLNIASGVDHADIHEGVSYNGTPLRIYTTSLPYPYEGRLAVMVVQPLTSFQNSMQVLALLYAAIAALGVILAASSGLVIARASLAPVDRLTKAAEHIARTEDLSVKLPIDGDDEIARLSEAFNTMTGALAVSRERQRRLIEDAGHELRTPLTSLRTNIDLLLRSAATGRPLPDGEAPRMLTSIDAQLRELSDLVIDVLALARGDQVATDGAKREVALQKVVERALGRARLRGPDHEIAATTEPWYVVGNPASLERAVLNILDNAIKFSPPGGPIEVTLRQGKLTVRDHGPGITREDATAVFERFWRSPTARALPGSGLGLAIVSQVMREVGGTVTLAAAPGGGAIATCVFPGSPSESSPEPVGSPIPQPH